MTNHYTYLLDLTLTVRHRLCFGVGAEAEAIETSCGPQIAG